MELTEEERRIIHKLLIEQGISLFEILPAAPEGVLIDSPFPDVRSLTGYIVTPMKAYDFWLGWDNESYTLNHQGYWSEYVAEPHSKGGDDQVILAVQKQLNQNGEIPKK